MNERKPTAVGLHVTLSPREPAFTARERPAHQIASDALMFLRAGKHSPPRGRPPALRDHGIPLERPSVKQVFHDAASHCLAPGANR